MAVVAAVNNERVLARDLLASPMVSGLEREPFLYRGAKTIGEAYNAGIDATEAPILVFAHQDVYFPAGWDRRLATTLTDLEAVAPHWAVLGLIGVTDTGAMAGQVWSSGSNREFRHAIADPQPAQSLDELVLVLRRASGLRFDPELPHFHLYGTDIVQAARTQGLGAFVIQNPVIHNSDQLTGLGCGFYRSYRYMQRKWAATLPVRTPVCCIEKQGIGSVLRTELVLRRTRWRQKGQRNLALPDPRAKSVSLGYETLA